MLENMEQVPITTILGFAMDEDFGDLRADFLLRKGVCNAVEHVHDVLVFDKVFLGVARKDKR